MSYRAVKCFRCEAILKPKTGPTACDCPEADDGIAVDDTGHVYAGRRGGWTAVWDADD